MPPDEAHASAAAWLAVAEEDLAVAALILREGRSAGMASFHAQQAGEKALKAYLAWLGHSPIPRTHDLAALAELAVAAGGQLLPEKPLTLLSP